MWRRRWEAITHGTFGDVLTIERAGCWPVPILPTKTTPGVGTPRRRRRIAHNPAGMCGEGTLADSQSAGPTDADVDDWFHPSVQISHAGAAGVLMIKLCIWFAR